MIELNISKQKKIFKLVKYYISGNYREFGRLKTLLGDRVSVVRKQYRRKK